LEFASKLCGFEKFLPLHQYDDKFRRRRKLIHQQQGTDALVARFNKVQEVETWRFLLNMLNNPSDVVKHVRA
jgi:hypothetical protein